MTIGIDARTLEEGEYSGVSYYTLNLLEALFELESKNTSPHNYKLFYNSAFPNLARRPQFIYPFVETVSLRYPNKLFNWGMQKFLRRPKIDQLLGADLFFAPNFNFIAWSQRVKKVITVHDLSFLEYPRFYSWRGRLWHRFLSPGALLAAADRIVAVSENTKNDILERYNLDGNKVKVIYSGVGEEFFAEPMPGETQRVRDKYGLPEKFILYLGNLEPRKNLAALIGAFRLLISNSAELKGLALVLAGAANHATRNILRQIGKYELADQVRLLGYVDAADKPALYRLAVVFAYPSIYEGFGFPPLEAMASGTPVVASKRSSLPEISDTAALYIDPYDKRDIAAALRVILTDHELRNRLIADGQKQAAKYNWAKTAREYLALFDSLK